MDANNGCRFDISFFKNKTLLIAGFCSTSRVAGFIILNKPFVAMFLNHKALNQ
jgi:hypothetical protein